MSPAAPVQVRSDSRPGLIYEVSPDHCPCEAFAFGRRRDAFYVCKHILAAFPPASPKVYCYGCGQYPVSGHRLFCEHCSPSTVEQARALLCTICDEQPAQAGSELCAGCQAVQVADDAAYAPDAPVTASPIYAETMRAVTGAPAMSRNQERGMRRPATLTDADAPCADCGQLVPHGARTSFPLCPACRTTRLVTGRAHTASTLAAGGNPFA